MKIKIENVILKANSTSISHVGNGIINMANINIINTTKNNSGFFAIFCHICFSDYAMNVNYTLYTL